MCAASKGALETLTRAFANELAAHKIRGNAVSPGLTETEGVRSTGVLDSHEVEYYKSHSPFRRLGQPADIAKVAVFLAADDSG